MTRKTSNILLGFLAVVLAAILVVLLFFLLGSPEPETAEPTAATTLPQQSVQTSATAATTVPATTVPPTTVYVPEISPDQVGIYIPAADGTKARKYITEFHAPRAAKTDIDCFEIIASEAARLDGSSFADIWRSAWESFDGWQSAKIGYHLRFTLSDGSEIAQTIRKPSDAGAFFEYLEVYIYDDIHQTGWYSHLEDKDLKDDTVMSSIKLHCGSRIAEVGDIELTAFIYNGDDCFDTEGNYIGLVKQTIVITE